MSWLICENGSVEMLVYFVVEQNNSKDDHFLFDIFHLVSIWRLMLSFA